MESKELRLASGRALSEISGSEGWEALKIIAAEIDGDATKELKEREEGGDRNRGKCDGLEELFNEAEKHIKLYLDTAKDENDNT